MYRNTTPAEAANTFDYVDSVASQWADGPEATLRLQTLTTRLSRGLADRSVGTGRRHRIETPSGQHTCDVVVDDCIGVKLFWTLSPGTEAWVRRELDVLTERYDYLLVVGVRFHADRADSWRSIVRSERRWKGDDSIRFFATFDRESSAATDGLTTRTAARLLGELVVVAVAIGLLSWATLEAVPDLSGTNGWFLYFAFGVDGAAIILLVYVLREL